MRTEAPFTADFVLERKAQVTEGDDGDLYIEGFAADWLLDRQDDTFEPGAFDMSIKSFMDNNPILVYHHQYDKALGQVIEAANKPEGLWVKARVDKPAQGSWAEDVFDKIKRGTIRGFSVGGIFHRRMGTDGRPRIHKADFMELSVTPLPINSRTLFQVAGKAFGEDEGSRERVKRGLSGALDRIETALEQVMEVKSMPAAKRERAKKAGHAFSDGAYPIENCKDVKDAHGLRNSSKNHSPDSVKSHIQKHAKRLGCPDPYAD